MPTIVASEFSFANSVTISAAPVVCSLTRITMRPWKGCGPRPSVSRTTDFFVPSLTARGMSSHFCDGIFPSRGRRSFGVPFSAVARSRL